MAKEFLTAAENAAEIKMIKSSISVEDLLKLDSIIVHGDRFHLDDVAFVAEIIVVRQENGVTSIPEILRISRNDVQKTIDELETNNKKYIIGDIGNGLFDHHDQLVVRNPINGGFENLSFIEKKRLEQPYTASSKLWLAIGSELIGEEFTSRVDRDFFMPLDANDNFGSIKAENVFNGYQKMQNPLSLTISWLNGDPKDPVAQMSNFMKAVEFLVSTFRGMINNYKNLRKSYEENHVAEIEKSAKNGIVIPNNIVTV